MSAIVAATGAHADQRVAPPRADAQAGVVSRRRDGNAVYYRVADPEFVEICRSVCVRIAGRIDAQTAAARSDLLDFARAAR